MVERRFVRIGLQAMAMAAMLTLAACGQPTPNPTPEAPPPPPPVAPLAGGAAPAAPPPPVAASEPGYPAAPNPPVSAATESYSVAPSSSEPVIAMQPIPNPGDPGSAQYYGGPVEHRPAAPAGGYRRIAPPRTVTHAVAAPTATRRAAPHAATAARPATHGPAPQHPVAKLAPPKAVAKPGSPVAKTTPAVKSGVPVLAPPSAKPVPAGNAEGAVPLGDRAARLASLETALAEAVKKGAVLKQPERFTPGMPADVILTIPADFADKVKDEAMKNDLKDAATSVNLTAVLSGDGYAATPDAAQSQPLTAGQPTQFHWSVVAQDGAKGPLHADVGANLLGSGSDVLNLGSIQAGGEALGFMKSNRMLGIGILAVLAVLVLAWLARGRSAPAASPNSRRGRTERPVMLGDDKEL